MEHKEHDEPRGHEEKWYLPCFCCPFLYPFARSSPAKARVHTEKLQNSVAEMVFVDMQKKICGLRVLGGNQQSVSRKGTECTKKSFRIALRKCLSSTSQKTTLWAFESLVGINKTSPAKARSTQRKALEVLCGNAFLGHHRKIVVL